MNGDGDFLYSALRIVIIDIDECSKISAAEVSGLDFRFDNCRGEL